MSTFPQSARGMKKRNVKTRLRQEIDKWLETIDDPELIPFIERDLIVTGGAIPSLLIGERVNDLDIYFSNPDTLEKVADYYVKMFTRVNREIRKSIDARAVTPVVKREGDRIKIHVQSAGAVSESQDKYQYFELQEEGRAGEFIDSMSEKDAEVYENLPKYRPVFMTENAITLSQGIQLVLRFCGDPEVIHKNYDFVHATCYYLYDEDHLSLPPKALECLLSKTLIYQGSLYPLCSMFRVRKFINRGWTISVGQLLKIAWQISELDLSDPKVVEEQLTGVDVAYLNELITALSERGNREIDSTYIAELVDKIFDE